MEKVTVGVLPLPPEASVERDFERSSSLRVPARVALWVGGALIALWLMLQWGATTPVNNDFVQNVWLPSRLVLDGANPYHPARRQVDSALGMYSPSFATFNSGKPNYFFIYPMWVALMLAPFGVMPLVTATAVWRAASLLLFVWGVGAVLRAPNPMFRLKEPAVSAAIGITVLLALLFRESFVTFFLGQFSIIEFGLLAAIWGWLASSGRLGGRRQVWGDALAGLALAVLVTKPQATGLAVLLLVLWAISHRRWAVPFGAVASSLLLLVVPMLLYPSSVGDWFSVVLRGQATSQATVSASVWGLSYQWLGASSPWAVVAAILSLLGVAFLMPAWWRDLRDKTSPVPVSLPLTLCMTSVISPYLLGYEQVLLLIPALVILAAVGLPNSEGSHADRSAGRRWRLAIYTWMAILPWFVVAVQSAIDKEYHKLLEYPVVVQSATMLALCWLAGLRWEENVKRNA